MGSTDNIAILTSENVRLDYTLAGLGSRLAAFILDMAIIVLASIAITFFFFTLGFSISDLANVMSGMSIMTSLYLVAITVLNWGYFFLFEWINWGQTPGKHLMGLRVSMADGAPVDMTAAAVRNVIRLVDLLLSGVGITIFIMLFTPKYQRLGDLTAGTVVVRRRRLTIDQVMDAAEAAENRMMSLKSTGEVPKALARIAVSDAEIRVIERFLTRRGSLPDDLRSKLSKDLSDRIRSKSIGEELHELGNEELLEGVLSTNPRNT